MMDDESNSNNTISHELNKPSFSKEGHVCSVCQKWFKRSSDLRRHESVHSDERPIPCDHCNLRFKTKDQLYQHRRYFFREANFQCDTCQKSFKFKSALKQHSKFHTKEKPYHCEMCKMGFPFKSYLNYHYGSKKYLEHHRKFAEFKKFEYLVKKYKRVVTNHVYNCKMCDKQFNTQQSLCRHHKIHDGTNLAECDMCGLKVNKKNLKMHKIAIHSNSRELYFCDICNKPLSTKYTLRIHKAIIHEQNKPFKCEICSKSFQRNCVLRTHIRLSHNKERKHVCEICGKSYASITRLKLHIRDHTGEKPYICYKCDKCFKGSVSLKRHSKTCKVKKINLETKKSGDNEIKPMLPISKNNNLGLSIQKNKDTCSALSKETLQQKNFNLPISQKSLAAAKEAFNKGDKVFETENIKFIKVQNTAELNILRVTNLFNRYRYLSNT